MAQTPDPYRTLGLKRDATEAEVKAAHRRLAKRFHPDAGGNDSDRFLRVQEAYRVLSDPLLRKEWDARHAPGPIRADRQPAAPRQRAPRRQPAAAQAQGNDEQPGAGGAPDTAGRPRSDDRPPAARPRSKRAYTWSASEVPWWEEGATTNRRPLARRRPQGAPGPTGPGGTAAEPSRPPTPGEAPNAFDVYNRSSGAAWSMAARAYFRRGEQELPRRGAFRYEGTQVMTGGRARTAADAETRRRQAELRHQAAAATAQAAPPRATAHPGASAPPASSAAYARSEASATTGTSAAFRTRPVRRPRASMWPSIAQRLVLALIAWIPIAGFLAAAAPPDEEISAQVVMFASLIGLVALPRVAYIGAVAAIGLLVVGAVVIGAFTFAGIRIPSSVALVSVIGAGAAVGYLAIAGLVLLGPPALRPWS